MEMVMVVVWFWWAVERFILVVVRVVLWVIFWGRVMEFLVWFGRLVVVLVLLMVLVVVVVFVFVVGVGVLGGGLRLRWRLLGICSYYIIIVDCKVFCFVYICGVILSIVDYGRRARRGEGAGGRRLFLHLGLG